MLMLLCSALLSVFFVGAECLNDMPMTQIPDSTTSIAVFQNFGHHPRHWSSSLEWKQRCNGSLEVVIPSY